LSNIKQIKRLRGGDLQVAAQENVQIAGEIGQKDHFRMGTVCRFEHATSSESVK